MRLGLGLDGSRPRVLEPRTIMPGIKAWYGGQATVASGLVSSWSDLSGNGHNATEATAKPSWVTGVANGRPVVRFAGAQKLASSYGSTVVQPWCVLVVASLTGALNEALVDGVDSTNRIEVYQSASTTISLFAGTQINGTNVAIGALTTYLLVANGASSIIRANGSQIASGAVGSNGVAGLTIGSNFGGAHNITGDVAALVHWAHAPSAVEIARAEQWARAEWGTW